MSTELWDRFNCHRCGKCCTEIGLPYDHSGLPDIADFLGINVGDLLDRYYGRRVGSQLEFDDSKRKPCPFLEARGNQKACAIYPVRPEGCRAYPLETDFADQEIGCPAYAAIKANLRSQ